MLGDLDFQKIDAPDLLLVESVRVHHQTDNVSFVDIESGTLWQLKNDELKQERIAPMLSFAEPWGHRQFLVGAGQRLGVSVAGAGVSWTEPLLPVEYRFNDACIDSLGRLVVGTLSLDPARSSSENYLFVLESDGKLSPIRRNVGLSNGIAVDPVSGDLLHADTSAHSIHRIPLDNKSGDYGEPELVHRFENGENPDGLIMLETGELLVALWGSAGLAAVDINHGEVDRIAVPPIFPTSVCIGKQSSELFLGSASQPRHSVGEGFAPGALWRSATEFCQVPSFGWNPVPLSTVALGEPF